MFGLITFLESFIKVTILNQNFMATSIKVDAVHAHALPVREVHFPIDMVDSQLLGGVRNTCRDYDFAVLAIKVCRLNGSIICRRDTHVAPEHATLRQADINAIRHGKVVSQLPHVFAICGRGI